MKKQKETADQLPQKSESQRPSKTSKTAKVFALYLGDITELSIEEESGIIERIRGIVVVDDAHYRISLRIHHWANPDIGDKPKYRYTGTISMLSPIGREVLRSEVRKRRLQDSGKADLKEKDYYASSPYYTNKMTAEDIAKDIRAIIQELYNENKDQFEDEYGRYLPTDKLTPKYALLLYLDDYLSAISTHSDRIANARRHIEDTFDALDNIPLVLISRRTVAALIRNKNISNSATSDCHAFFDYLINLGKVPAHNIFPVDNNREPGVEEKNRKAFACRELSDEAFSRFFALLNRKTSTAYCGVALYASGYYYEDEIEDLLWKDLVFVKGYNDFAVVPVLKDKLVISKHDYSRPCIPDTALYLRRVFNALCAEYGQEIVLNWHIIAQKEVHGSEETYLETPIPKKVLGEVANDLLVMAGYDFTPRKPGRPTDAQATLALRVLTENYHRMLVTKAGLAHDADTRYFLEGRVLRSSTYTNYESHTSPEAQYRLYKILLPISTEKKINPPRIKEKNTFAATPKTNHEVAQVTGQIRLKPGEAITIRVPSGVTGPIDVSYPDTSN